MIPRALLIPAALAALAAGAAATETPTLQSMVAAERAFAARALEKGTKDAFLAYLASDAVIFNPTPANGRKAWEARPESPAKLVWAPAYAEVSAAGDLGFDYGPWERTPTADGKQPTQYGTFATVWRRLPGSAWRVALDLGVSHERSEKGPAEVELEAGPVHEPPDTSSQVVVTKTWTPADLVRRDRAYSQMTRMLGLSGALERMGAQDVRLLREGRAPVLGMKDAGAYLAGLDGRMRYLPDTAYIAASRDLGYSYGIAVHLPQDTTAARDSSAYLHVWRKVPGFWQLALEALSPIKR